MGDAGMILFGPVGREVLAAGTVIFAVFATGSQLLAGQTALSTLSDSRLCLMLYTGIFAVPTLLFSLPRTMDRLSWLSIPAVASILVAGLVGMVGAGLHPVEGRTVDITRSSDFVTAFVSITNPVFAYAGHFMFFILISEMKDPRGAMKAAYTLQGFATSFYVVFSVVTYYYLGSEVTSPSFSSLPPVWAKAAYGIAIPNFLIAGFFWLYDAYHYGLGKKTWSKSWSMTTLSVLTILAGLFICVAGLYATIDGIVVAYRDGTVSAPFSC